MNVARANDNRAGFAELWRKLAKTPMRDVMRGRLSARLDVDRVIDRSSLQPELGDAVRATVRAGRMNRLERAEVAEELISHFAEGLAAGRSEEHLLDTFGDPKRSGRIIARAKRRQRPAVTRWSRRLVYAVPITIVAYLLLGVMLSIGDANPSTDYVRQFNQAAIAVPPEDRAWPAYRDALIALPDRPAAVDQVADLRPGDAEWPLLEAYLRENADALHAIRRAADMPGLGFVAGHFMRPEDTGLYPEIAPGEPPTDEPRLLITLLLPHLAELRAISRTLADEALLAAEDGDAQLVADDVTAMLGVARHVRETPSLIADLVAIDIASTAIERLGEILERHPDLLEEQHMVALAHRFGAADGLFDVRSDGERLMILDLFQHIYTDDGGGDGRITSDGLQLLVQVAGSFALEEFATLPDNALVDAGLMPLATTLIAPRDEMLDMYDRLTNLALRRGEQRPREWIRDPLDAAMDELASDRLMRIRYLPVLVMIPAYTRAIEQQERAIARRDGLLVALALTIHRRRTGEWPDSLDVLVPDLLPAVPLDPFTGKPLSYTINEGRPVVYSVGHDRIDDGGTFSEALERNALYFDQPGLFFPAYEASKALALINADPRAARRQYPNFVTGDWILWPRPEPRPIAAD